MNGPGVAAQPTEGLGAKSGGASAGRAAPVRHTNAPTPIPTVAANLDMATPSLMPAVYRQLPMMYSRYGSAHLRVQFTRQNPEVPCKLTVLS